jgi:hypothetical protein
MMSEWTVQIAFVGGVVLLVGTRSIYGLLDPTGHSRDSFAHLLFATDIAENGHRIPAAPSKAATEGVYAYPYLMHWLLSFVPSAWYGRIERYFSGLNDLVLALLLSSLVPLGVLDPAEALIALLVVIATPELMRPDLSHGVGISARKPGLLLMTGSVLGFVVWLDAGTGAYLALSVLAAAGVLLTSKFSTQALMFVMVPMGLLVSPVGFLVLATAFTLAVGVSKGRYLDILRGHVSHLCDYAVSKQFKITYTKPEIRLPALGDVDSVRDLLEIGYRNAWVRPVVMNPAMAGVVVVLLVKPEVASAVKAPPGMLVWFGASVGAFLLTSLPYLRFLGQAERYLEYGIIPAAATLAVTSTRVGGSVTLVAGAAILVGLAMIPALVWAHRTEFSNRRRSEELADVVEWLGGLADGTVLVQPIWTGRNVAWHTDHVVVDFVLNGGTTTASHREIRRLFPEEYGVVTADVEWIERQFSPDVVLFDTATIEGFPENALRPPDGRPAYRNGRWEVYEFDELVRSAGG